MTRAVKVKDDAEDLDRWGPLMSALTDQERAFVTNMFLKNGNATPLPRGRQGMWPDRKAR